MKKIVDISFVRNNTTLISNLQVDFSEEILEDEIKNKIFRSIKFSPSFSFILSWESSRLLIRPTISLDELTKYNFCLGDDDIIEKSFFSFFTGPNIYLTRECMIKPSHWKNNPDFKIDTDMIIRVYYHHIHEWHYNPVTSAQFALACYDDYISTGNENSKKIFFQQVRFFRENCHEIGEMIAFPYLFPFNSLQPPWYSGLAQGQVLSVLVRAFILTEDVYYLDFAEKVTAFMFLPTNKSWIGGGGGVFTYTPEGFEWIEEYPTVPASYVWNGFVFAVMGLIDYNKLHPTSKNTEHIRQFILSIKGTINIYDRGYKLLYDRFNTKSKDGFIRLVKNLILKFLGRDKHYCGLLYTGLQAYQCKHLYYATKDEFFMNTYEKWRKHFDYDKFISLYKMD
jgi:hypothetical protein